MDQSKKNFGIRIFLIIYGVSYILNSVFFVDRKKVVAENTTTSTNLVAILIDKDLYENIKSNIQSYATDYIQQKISNSKAIVLPINIKTFKAPDITKMLENMYFDGLKNETSKLVGTILIGDIPLPVVHQNGFIYPSIYPYVDFEDQEFIYNANTKFFEYNDNPNGQAEIWHSMINFNTTKKYTDFFKKLNNYNNDPQSFISPKMRYDDFVGLKKFFMQENINYYVNNFIFSEDIGYHRYNDLLLSILKKNHNDDVTSVGSNLKDGVQGTSKELEDYAKNIASISKEAEAQLQNSENSGGSKIPTLLLQKTTQEMLKTYDGLISSKFLSTINDNISSISRYYKKNGSGIINNDINSHFNKIIIKDSWILGNGTTPPLLVQLNNQLQEDLNNQIEEEKYYMNIPLPLTHLEFKGRQDQANIKFKGIKIPIAKKYCTREKYNFRKNYYFGIDASNIDSAENLSIYRGTFQNLTGISEIKKSDILKSIGGSYNIFSTQIQANKGYNLLNIQNDLNTYNNNKITTHRKQECSKYLFGISRLPCIKAKQRVKDDNADQNKCYIGDNSKQGGCESIAGFAKRNRGGASAINLNFTTNKLNYFNYTEAQLPIYDIGGSIKIDNKETESNSYSGISKYLSIKQERKGGDGQSSTNINILIDNPNVNGNPEIFNQSISTDYSKINIFNIYNDSRKYKNYGKYFAIYKTSGGKCGGEGNIYTYKTIDSRVKNISPTPTQMLGSSEGYKFGTGSDLMTFYNNIIFGLSSKGQNIINDTIEFSGKSTNDTTGIISNLENIKSYINKTESDLNLIISFNENRKYTTGEIEKISDTRNLLAKTISADKLKETIDKTLTLKDTLNDFANYIISLSLDDVESYFEQIIINEKIKEQKVEILINRKNKINSLLNNNENAFNNYIIPTLNNAAKIYSSTKRIADITKNLNKKAEAIDEIIVNGCPAGQKFCGCDVKYYKKLCDAINNLTGTLNSNTNNINNLKNELDNLPLITSSDSNGDAIDVNLFKYIKEFFDSTTFLTDISNIKKTMDSFTILSDTEINKKEIIKGMTIVTQDRPIDNIRNITFQGIGGGLVKFNYPNLYDVQVFKKDGDSLILKKPTEIKDSIKNYLNYKVGEYNDQLINELNNKNSFYNKNLGTFNLLLGYDKLATPNRNYNLMTESFLLDSLVKAIDNLANKFGKESIFGTNKISDDDKLNFLSELLYYQNLPRTEKAIKDKVEDDIQENQNSFDINQKIKDTLKIYLTQDNYKGKIGSPDYSNGGYEVAYINSDGSDYVSSKTIPSFIQDIQNKQVEEKKPNIPKANSFIENFGNETIKDQNQLNSECGFSGEPELLLDIKTMNSPRLDAFKCWLKNVVKKPFEIKISFSNSMGPTFQGFLNDLGSSFESQKGQRSEYKSQWQGSDETKTQEENQNLINNSSNLESNKLGEINNLISFKSNHTSRNFDDIKTIEISSSRDLGKINVQISQTGDNCLILNNSTNLCEKILYLNNLNVYSEPKIFNVNLENNKSGLTSVSAKFCLINTDKCITKNIDINVLPNPLSKIEIITTTNIISQGGQIPIILQGYDDKGNSLGLLTENYTISVNSGDGKFVGNGNSVSFNDFSNANFIYQAPGNLIKNKQITITVSGTNKVQKEISTTKKIIIAKGFLKINDGNQIIYNNGQTNKIEINLPPTEKDIESTDSNGIKQINIRKIKKITLTLQDINGNKLDSVANIATQNNLLTIGNIKTLDIISGTNTFKQNVFIPNSNYIISDGKLDIYLYPNFKAGEDNILINIPGFDPITINTKINSGPAKKINLILENNNLSMSSDNQKTTGTLQILDNRNNIVTLPSKIKLGIIGSSVLTNKEKGLNINFVSNAKNETEISINAVKGGESYIYAYIKNDGVNDITIDEQMPGYQRVIVQDKILPTDKLNILYLNLFGTDRGNQRGYFSQNNKFVNDITSKSEKLLSTTTQLIDPNKIKKIDVIVDDNGQIQNLAKKQISLIFKNSEIRTWIQDVGSVYIDKTNTFTLQKITNTGSITLPNKNTIFYIPEITDSIIKSNEIKDNKILINGTGIIDFRNGFLAQNTKILLSENKISGLNIYEILVNDVLIGKILLYKINVPTGNNQTIQVEISKNSVTQNINKTEIFDNIKYLKKVVFAQGSTNGVKGIGFCLSESSFTDEGYESIQNSIDTSLGIGFTSKFKNITNFGNGKNVGESTLNYSSQFLINFGDPLIKRVNTNLPIQKTDYDGSIGQDIFSDPNKTIFKVLPIDFNNDGLQDILVTYTDGSIKILKNYGGKQPYKNLQDLLFLQDSIKDIFVGDVDGNKYPDIIVRTQGNKLKVHKNIYGVFDVDGNLGCLNTNALQGNISKFPDDLQNVQQIFFQDMNKDGKLDIITNDNFGDIKIFYGGSNKNGDGNYLSKLDYTCDDLRYTRQKSNYKLIKNFGLQIKPDSHIQDQSIIHRKGLYQGIDTDNEISKDEVENNIATKTFTSPKEALQYATDLTKTITKNTNSYISSGQSQLNKYINNPLDKLPIYETDNTLTADQLLFVPISNLNVGNDPVNIYKQFQDVNGGMLQDNDLVLVKTTIIGLKNNIKYFTYLDQIQGPRNIQTDKNNKINGFQFMNQNTGDLIVSRSPSEDYDLMIDNIKLSSGSVLQFIYTLRYKQPQINKIEIKDEQLKEEGKIKDGLPDITTSLTDSCQKGRIILFNRNRAIDDFKGYEEIFDDVQKKLDEYTATLNANQNNNLNNAVDAIQSSTTQSDPSTIAGIDSITENFDWKDMFSAGDGLSVNVNFIDNMTEGVSEKLDTALQGLCQGFKIGGKKTCQGLPVPFNQAFLAPGQYHLFGCIKLPVGPLEGGLPVFFFPGSILTPVGTIPIPYGQIQKPGLDGFLRAGGGVYPSMIRIYVAPTLTLGVGMAICGGPYGVAAKIPKPFRDLGGNCIVFAMPPLTGPCKEDNTGGDNNENGTSIANDEVSDYFKTASENGTCNSPTTIANGLILDYDNFDGISTDSSNGSTIINFNQSTFGGRNIIGESNNAGSKFSQGKIFGTPFQVVSMSENSNSPTYQVPNGNFGGLFQFNQKAVRIQNDESTNSNVSFNYGDNISDGKGFSLQAGEKINLKILGGKVKGLVKCIIQDRMTQQISYIQNNLTKMTVQITLPDVTNLLQGFDKIGSYSANYKNENQKDQSAGYTKNISGSASNIFQQQTYTNISQTAGENPFEAIKDMFKEVPLVNINTKDINIKVPMLTDQDINTYSSYLSGWILKQETILQDRTSMINKLLAFCGTTEKTALNETLKDLETTKKELTTNDNTLKNQIEIERKKLQIVTVSTVNEMSDWKHLGTNISNSAQQISSLPVYKLQQTFLEKQKEKQGANFTQEKQDRLDRVNTKISKLSQCSNFLGGIQDFITFKENSAQLIKSVKQNIQVVQSYKEFPTKLYEWIHVTDRYMTEISSILSEFVGKITYRLNTNANKYSQWIDSIIILIGAIKTRQAIIDFSVNRSEKCSKCSNDNYGSFSCSLSFLCPKLPILPIPPFKIPSLFIDLSNIDLGISILLPKFNFTPIKIPLPKLPDLPQPPKYEINLDVFLGLDINFAKSLEIPTIPIIPGPPNLPELPSFLPTVNIDLPTLPPAPKIPKISPNIQGILKTAGFLGKIFCIIKGGIGLVAEKGVKGKIEQITQRTWNVPIFDYFDQTTTFKNTPLKGFDYKIDAYLSLKFNFDGVYDLLNSLASNVNSFVSQKIETPVQQGVNNFTNKANNNKTTDIFQKIEDGSIVNDLSSYSPKNNFDNKTTEYYKDYNSAYNDLSQGLAFFKLKTKDDTQSLNKVNSLISIINTKGEVTTESKQIKEIENQSQSLIQNKQKEIQTIANQIKNNYNEFLNNLKDNKIQLVKDEKMSVNFKTSLFTLNNSAKDLIYNQEHPDKTYLDINKGLIKGYLDAINNNSAINLNMTDNIYSKSKKYLENLSNKINQVQPIFEKIPENKTENAGELELLTYNENNNSEISSDVKGNLPITKPIIADTSCSNGDCGTNGGENNGYSPDISSYVNGIFVETYSGDEKNYINVVNSQTQIDKVNDNYFQFDINNDEKSDIIMRDENSIYVKYNNQNDKYPNETHHTNYYQAPVFDSPNNLKNESNDGYVKISDGLFNNIYLKLFDENQEVKNFKTQGQSFETISLGRTNSQKFGDKLDGYLIRLNQRIDNFNDKEKNYEKFYNKKYILFLPEGTEYDSSKINLNDGPNTIENKIKNLITGTILSVQFYNKEDEEINTVLSDIDRHRQYIQISTIKNIANEGSIPSYKINSPWSNQITAGMQILGDGLGPNLQTALYRTSTKKIVSSGDKLDGFINTTYNLNGLREDNVAVAKMQIEDENGNILATKTGFNKTGFISLDGFNGLFFTGEDEKNYIFKATDFNNNSSTQKVTVKITVPEIEITKINQISEEKAQAIAKISNDIDSGNVIFQRLRNGLRKEIKGSSGNSFNGFSLSPNQTIITGGIFSIGNTIGFFDTDQKEIGNLNPENGKITINKPYIGNTSINLDFTTHLPVIKIIDNNKMKTLFYINLPSENLIGIEMLKGETIYKKVDLPNNGKYGIFGSGYSIQNLNKDDILYINQKGDIYIPGSYATFLKGDYKFDDTTKYVTYTIKDNFQNTIAKITIKTQNLAQ